MAIDVASQADWNTAVAAVAAAGANSTVTINITSGFTLSSSLAQLQASNANVTVNITGNSQTINGNSAYQGISVSGANAPTVSISSLSLTNTAAIGGNGQAGQNGYYSSSLSYGSGGGGGGGLGAGGGLFVGSGANVTLSAVSFTGNTATGGTGGNGGSAQNAAADPTNGGNGGAGGAANNGGASGGGGAGGTGGHAGGQGTTGTAGATLGDGGGGGGGSGTTNSTSYTSNNGGGAGNAGGGAGKAGGDGVTNNLGSQGPGADGGSGGNGGAAQGGAIYVATGGTLTILDSPISGTGVTGGAGGNSGVGQGSSSLNGAPGLTGTGQGQAIYLNGATANIGVSSGTVTYADTISGTGLNTGGIVTAINKTGAGTLALSGANDFTGNVDIGAGTVSVAGTGNLGDLANGVVMSNGTTFAVTGTSVFGSGRAFQIAGSSTFDIAGGTTTTLQGVVSDGASSGSLIKTDTGTLLLSATNTYTGATDVEGGTLRAGSAGAFGASSAFTVAGGATLDLNGFNKTFGSLTGAGTVTGANTTISGTFAPGNGTAGSAMAITGNLAFQSGALYLVQLNPATSSLANVTGSATLTGATVSANFAAGAYVQKQYTILTATGGLGGGTFASLASTNLPTNFTASLSYDVHDAYLNLSFSFGTGLSGNQQSVANALTNYFTSTGSLPLAFASLSPAGLTQIDGEAATGAQGASFQLTNSFLALLTGGQGGFGGGPALPFAPEAADAFPPDVARAYASLLKAPAPARYEGYWAAWGAAFGGGSTTNGDPAVAGTNSVSAHAGAFAAGLDYHVTPDTIFGFALGGGGVGWGLGAGLGGGHGDTFLAGLYGSKAWGPAYLSGALTFSSNWMTTSRSVAVVGPDTLTASFNAQNFGGRLEGGYRLPAAVGFSVTPYAAAQAQAYYSPAYRETGALAVPDPAALAFNAQNATVVRSELGSRFDRTFRQTDAGAIDLFGRVAFAHDWQNNPNLTATFLGLPTATFVVNGAAPPADLALLTAGAEWRWGSGWSVMAKFDGEFAERSQTYTGTARVKYTW